MNRSCRQLHDQPFEWNYFPLLTVSIVQKKNLEKIFSSFFKAFSKKKVFAGPYRSLYQEAIHKNTNKFEEIAVIDYYIRKNPEIIARNSQDSRLCRLPKNTGYQWYIEINCSESDMERQENNRSKTCKAL